ncbi:unnamed protein product [Caenorhabditis angaria]|uniref:Nuclear pore complex protein Nup85 n=1 Tax=Caenorhabditis angaria TaxID=860376 RepID=A0A9P1MRV7_9PELO|nr:unnamed protein product [Caenorhabditis angaria]
MESGRLFDIAVSDSSTAFAYIDTESKDDECKIEIVEKVCQQRVVFSKPSVRRLIIEMYAAFNDCQKLAQNDDVLDPTTSCEISRSYRSILLNAAIAHSNSDLLDDFSLWSLYEKLYFSRSDGSICADLISWANESFTFVKTATLKAAEEFNPSAEQQSEEYWKGVALSLLTCNFKECIELLSMFSNEPAVDRFLSSLEMFSTDLLIDEGKTDKLNEWKETLTNNLKFGKYGNQQNIIFLTKLLIGNEDYLGAMASRLIDNWWTFIPFYVLVKNPLANYGEFVNSADECRQLFEDPENTKNEPDVFWCLISKDDASFYQLIMDNPWLSVHLVDLIQKSTKDAELIDLRRNLILNYASSLILHSSLWEIGVGYLLQCGTEGLLRLESHIEGIHIEDEEMAENLFEICEINRLDDAKSCVTNTMTYRYLRMEEWSAALGWALKSGSKKSIDTVVSKIVGSSSREEMASLSVLNTLRVDSVHKPSLSFLYNYQRFVKMMQSGELSDCVKHLVPLIMMPDVPTQYYSDLFDYLIFIIKEDDMRTGIRFPKEILYELSTFLATFSLDKSVDLEDGYLRRVKVLKKMVMLKLAESISKGIMCQ